MDIKRPTYLKRSGIGSYLHRSVSATTPRVAASETELKLPDLPPKTPRNKHTSRRGVYFTLIALVCFELFVGLFRTYLIRPASYALSSEANKLLSEPVPEYAQKLNYESKTQSYQYNKEWQPGKDVAGQNSEPQFGATFYSDSQKGIDVYDPINKVTMSFMPRFSVAAPEKSSNRVVYPIYGKDAQVVYTLRQGSLKEDIILNEFQGDNLNFKYQLKLSDGTEARVEKDGSLGVYGVNSALLGSVTTSSDKDAALLQKARQNGKKTNLLFAIPAPVINEVHKSKNQPIARFDLQGDILNLQVANLKDANYPLSVDPSVFITTAADFMRGNNESNVDFDTTNELIQKGKTTGARINEWDNGIDLNEGRWNAGTAAAGGYLYEAGGITGLTIPKVMGSQTTTDATDGTTFTMDMPAVRPAGDLYIAMFCHDGSTGANVTGPGGGWVEYADLQGYAAYYKIGTDQGGGNEAATYSWTGPSEAYAGVIVRVTGFDPSDVESGTPATGFSASSVTPVYPTQTPDTDSALIVRGLGVDADTPSTSAWVPAGHTKIASGTSGGTACGFTSAYLNSPVSSGVATGTATMADASMSDDYGASTLAIKANPASTATSASVQWAKLDASTGAPTTHNPGNGACTNFCTNSAYDLPAARAGFSLVAYNGFLYAIGGVDSGGTRQSTVYIAKLGANGEPSLWHPTGGTKVYWYTDTALGTAKSYTAAAAYNNTLYLLGGSTAASANGINVVEKADIKPTGALGTWTTTGTTVLPSVRFAHAVQIYNDRMYLIGGNSGGTLQSSVSYIKINSDGTMASTWTTTSAFSTARMTWGGNFTAVWGAYIYIAGGCSTLSSGNCSAISSDIQIASINADGSIDKWDSVPNVVTPRIGYGLAAWRSTLYMVGGCMLQNTSTGACLSESIDIGYGNINQDGDIGINYTTVASGSGTCTGGSPTNCDFPSASVGNVLNAVALMNGYLYIMGGCSNNACGTVSTGVVYTAIGSDGTLNRPASCGAWTATDSYCTNSTSLPSARGAPGVAVFGGRIYLVGGWPSITNITYAAPNSDGSISSWNNTDTTTAGAIDVSYAFAYARANPSSASTTPGNLYIFGGCTSITSVSCTTMTPNVYKCTISTAGVPGGCTTTGQQGIGTVTGASGAGLGAHAGTVYANYIYLIGGLAPGISDLTTVRYAKFDDSNNVVAVTGSAWVESANHTSQGRRRGVAWGYNGYIYVAGGFDGTGGGGVLADVEFAKVDVSDGSVGAFGSSTVNADSRWGLTVAVSNANAYIVGGCTVGDAPTGCTTRTNSIKPLIMYNNDSGAPASYGNSANSYSTDRMGAGSTILNGYIYVAGGCTSSTECSTLTNSTQFASVDANTGALGSWSAGGNLPAAVAWGKLVNAGNTLYYVGGQSGTAETTAVATVYYTTGISTGNPTFGTASNGLPAARTKFGAAVWNNRIYITGGYSTAGTVQTTVYYSPTLAGNIGSAWPSATTSFNVARAGTTAVAYANNLYILGGDDGTNYLNDTQFATIGYKTGTISQSGTTVTGSGTTWTSSMVGYTLQYIDGTRATITSFTNSTTIDVSVSKTVSAGTLYTIQDGSVGAWTYTTSLPTAISQGDGFAANGYIYLFGGRSSIGGCTNKTLVAPISANTTTATNNNPTGVGEWFETNERFTGNRYGNSAAYYNGKVYITGGACKTFPSIDSVTSTQSNAESTTNNVLMPPVVEANDLLLVLLTTDGGTGSTVTTPSGWTLIGTSTTNGANVRAGVYAKVAAGTEDGANVNFVTSNAEKSAAQVYRVLAANWNGATAGVEMTGASAGSTTTPDPASLNPGGWGTEKTTWIAYAAGSTYSGVTNYPSGYFDGYHINSTTTDTTGASASSAAFESTAAASQDPGSFTMTSAQNGVAVTVAIRGPSTDMVFTTSNKVVQTALLSQPQIAKYSRMIDLDSDAFPTKYLANGLDNGIGASWMLNYQSSTNSTAAWGQNTNAGALTLGTPGNYTPIDGAGSNTSFARYYYLVVNIDASQSFGYPEDVARGPTITDLSLFFTSDPGKRLRHGKTFTGGVLQPLNTPF